MKFLRIMVLMASLLAIAGTAFFQLVVLLAGMLFAQHLVNRHSTRIS